MNCMSRAFRVPPFFPRLFALHTFTRKNFARIAFETRGLSTLSRLKKGPSDQTKVNTHKKLNISISLDI